MSETQELSAMIRVRLSANDAHYGGQLVNGAHMLSLFGDLATELAILCDGDEGLLVGYESIEFLAPRPYRIQALPGFLDCRGGPNWQRLKEGLFVHRAPLPTVNLKRPPKPGL